jgi:hypothetical protein
LRSKRFCYGSTKPGKKPLTITPGDEVLGVYLRAIVCFHRFSDVTKRFCEYFQRSRVILDCLNRHRRYFSVSSHEKSLAKNIFLSNKSFARKELRCYFVAAK